MLTISEVVDAKLLHQLCILVEIFGEESEDFDRIRHHVRQKLVNKGLGFGLFGQVEHTFVWEMVLGVGRYGSGGKLGDRSGR